LKFKNFLYSLINNPQCKGGIITVKVNVDKNLCTGCGLCTDTCPEIFEIQGDTATAKKQNVDDSDKELIEKIKEAAKNCPVEAIIIK
jgi:ferredoxin